MHFRRTVAAIALTSMLVAGCQPVDPKNTYTAAEAGHDAVVLYGVIKSSRPVNIQGNNSGTGAVLGATAGGLAGSAIGDGRGSIAAAIAGVVIGGIAGAAAEQAAANQQGVEYIINFPETGDTRSIVQALRRGCLVNGPKRVLSISG